MSEKIPSITEEHFIDASENTKLWLARVGSNNGTPVLLIHGAMGNSKIYYHPSGKGLAVFLANLGYDVYITDLRGKGNSKPLAVNKLKAGQWEVINEDLPLLVDFIFTKRNQKIHLMAHSWGGVIAASWYARLGHKKDQIRSFTFFGSKRKIYVQNFRRWFMVDLMWTFVGTISSTWFGYLPALKLKMGSDNEPRNFYLECNVWVYSNKWVDPRDKFDYKKAFEKINFPPLLSFTGVHDYVLGNKKCVKNMIHEIRPKHYVNRVLAKANGNLQDYDHVNILTHTDAVKDHFLEVEKFISNVDSRAAL